ncbi:hypothetical protein EON65_12110 [archaeon]|nr:MAG: hypothetical protein EON65_12110 [archaeon]
MLNNYYSFDLRDRDEREVEDHCTFRPQIIAESPFISERSLRKYSQQRTRNIPPPPPSSINGKANRDDSFDNNGDISVFRSSQLQRHPTNHSSLSRGMKRSAGVSHMPVVGMFTKKDGFSKTAPPQVGIPIYAFDPFFPPNFALGKYGKPVMEEIIVEETKSAVVEEKPVISVQENTNNKNKLAPPPLPPWLDNPNLSKATQAAGEPRKYAIVINKVNRENTVEEAPSGWQAVLAEMTAKRAQMKNKKPPPEKSVVEKKPPPKKIESGKRKKPKDFKDIMDELAYKFAVLRGEITEEDDGGEDDTAEGAETPGTDVSGKNGRFSPATAPSGDKKAGLKADPPRTDSPNPTGKKLGGKPDLAAMLAKVKSPVSKPPTPVPPAEAAKESKAPLKLPTPPGGAAGGGPSPAPAPLGKIAKGKPEQLPGAPPLPTAWPPVPYVAPPDAPIPVLTSTVPTAPVVPQVITPPVTVTTTVRKMMGEQKDLPEGFFIAGTKEDLIDPYEILHKGETTAEFIDKIAELMQRSSELDQGGESRALSESSTPSFLHDKKALQANRRLTVSDLPTPASFAAAVQRMKKSNEIRSATLELEKQLEFRNYSQTPPSSKKSSQSANGSYTPGSSISSQPQVSTPSKVSFYSDKYFENKQLSFRRSVEVSDEDRQPLCMRMEKVKANTTRTPLGSELGTVYWMQSLRSPPPAIHASTNVTGRQKESSESASTQNVREEYLRQLKSPTVPQSPYLRSQDTVDKRQSVRADRLSAAQQQEKEAQEQEKRRKERLRLKALETAMATGSYRPRRMNAHQKMIEKYGGKSELGLDLASVASTAYHQYASQHLASPAQDKYGYENYDNTQHSYFDPQYSQHYSPYPNSSPYYHSQHDLPQLGVDDLLLQQYEN